MVPSTQPDVQLSRLGQLSHLHPHRYPARQPRLPGSSGKTADYTLIDCSRCGAEPEYGRWMAGGEVLNCTELRSNNILQGFDKPCVHRPPLSQDRKIYSAVVMVRFIPITPNTSPRGGQIKGCIPDFVRAGILRSLLLCNKPGEILRGAPARGKETLRVQG